MSALQREGSALDGRSRRTGPIARWLQEDRSQWPDEMQSPDHISAKIFVDTAADPRDRMAMAQLLYDAVLESFPELTRSTEPGGRQGTVGTQRLPNRDLVPVETASWHESLELADHSLTHSWYARARRGPKLSSVTVEYQEVVLARPGSFSYQVVVSLGLGEPDHDGPAARLAQVARRFADQVNPAYGELTPYNAGAPPTVTNLDEALHRAQFHSADASRQYLRGYGWVTICPQELADRLGGPAALTASGAFCTVDQLHAGGLWLRATETVTSYRPVDAENVFDTLRPVLPPGQPDDDSDADLRWIVMEEA